MGNWPRHVCMCTGGGEQVCGVSVCNMSTACNGVYICGLCVFVYDVYRAHGVHMVCGVYGGVHCVICWGEECVYAGRSCMCVHMHMGCVGSACIVHSVCVCVWDMGERVHVEDGCVCVCVCLWEGQGGVRNGECSESGMDLALISAVPDLGVIYIHSL